MTTTHRRVLGAGIAATALAAFVAGTPAVAASGLPRRSPARVWPAAAIQLLSFNDYHGHLEATDPPLSKVLDPSQTPVGGAEYLATALSLAAPERARRAVAHGRRG